MSTVLLRRGAAGGAADGWGCRSAPRSRSTDLFAGLPVRRKFLKGRQAEAGAIHQVVGQYAIAYPGVAITLVADGQVLFSTAGAQHLRDVLACLYGVSLVDASARV